MSDFGSGVWRKARKRHRCSGCLGPILIGETYYRYVGNYEGEFQNWAMHEECFEDYDTNGECEFMPGDFPMPARVRVALDTGRGA